jgi:hypothetical protein
LVYDAFANVRKHQHYCGRPARGGKRDVAVIASDVPAVAAAAFTTNRVKAAPVLVGIERAGDQADDEPTDERADDACRQSASPGDTLRRLADDELRSGPDEHSEQDDTEKEHAASLSAFQATQSVRGRPGPRHRKACALTRDDPVTDLTESIDDQLRGWLICNARFIRYREDRDIDSDHTPVHAYESSTLARRSLDQFAPAHRNGR